MLESFGGKLSEFTHVYCENCGISPVIKEELCDSTTTTNNGYWKSGDLVCAQCRLVITSVFAMRDSIDSIDDEFGNR